jgi:hypothetical protein
MNKFPARWAPLIPGETCHGSSRKLTIKCQELQSPFSGSIATIERTVNVNKPLHYVQFASIVYKGVAAIAISFFSCFTNAANLCALYFFLDNGYKIRPLCTNAYTAQNYTLSSKSKIKSKPVIQIQKEN